MKYLVLLGVLACAGLCFLFFAMRARPKAGMPPIPLPEDIRQVVSNADRLELFSLDPNSLIMTQDLTTFYRWHISGRVALDSLSDRQRVASAVVRAVADGGTPAACFDPRHGIHAVQGNHAQDLIICFHCDQVQIYPGTPQAQFLSISKSARPILDEVLKRAGIAIAPDR